MSNAKIELMLADLPHIKYGDSKNKVKNKWDKDDPDYKKVADMNKQLLEKMKLKKRNSEPINEADYEVHKLSE